MPNAQKKTTEGEFVSPFADASRTKPSPWVKAIAEAEAVASPARMLQDRLEASIDGDGSIRNGGYSPRMVTSTVVTLCLAFWMAMYLAASVIL